MLITEVSTIECRITGKFLIKTWEESARNRSWHILKYCFNLHVEELGETLNHLFI